MAKPRKDNFGEPSLGLVLTMLRDEGHMNAMLSVLPFTFMVPISRARDSALVAEMRERYSMGVWNE